MADQFLYEKLDILREVGIRYTRNNKKRIV